MTCKSKRAQQVEALSGSSGFRLGCHVVPGRPLETTHLLPGPVGGEALWAEAWRWPPDTETDVGFFSLTLRICRSPGSWEMTKSWVADQGSNFHSMCTSSRPRPSSPFSSTSNSPHFADGEMESQIAEASCRDLTPVNPRRCTHYVSPAKYLDLSGAWL